MGAGIDLGCGDGRFTLQAAGHVDQMEGTDIGPALIEGAQRRAATEQVGNVEFRIADVLEPLDAGAYDLVMALGVTSCLVDDAVFTDFLGLVHAALATGGMFITVDSLAKSKERLDRYESGYVARYRNEGAYVQAIEAAGFERIEHLDLGTPSSNKWVQRLPVKRNSNGLYLFVRRDRA